MSVIDGQQRLTTNYKAYCNHPDLKNVVLDLGKGEFVINNEAFRKNQVPVGVLLNKDDKKLIEYTESNKVPLQYPLRQSKKIDNDIHFPHVFHKDPRLFAS